MSSRAMQQASQAISLGGKFCGGAAAEPLFSLYHSCSKRQFTSMGSKLAPHSHSHRQKSTRTTVSAVISSHQCQHFQHQRQYHQLLLTNSISLGSFLAFKKNVHQNTLCIVHRALFLLIFVLLTKSTNSWWGSSGEFKMFAKSAAKLKAEATRMLSLIRVKTSYQKIFFWVAAGGKP